MLGRYRRPRALSWHMLTVPASTGSGCQRTRARPRLSP